MSRRDVDGRVGRSFILWRANDDTAKRRRVRGDLPRPFASRSAARCTGHGTDDGNTPPRGSPPSGRRWTASKPRTPHRRASRAPETHWCRETKRQKLTVCRENARAKGPKCIQVSSWKNHGRFRKSALRVCRDVRAGCVLTAPHTGPSTPRPRGHRERDAFARDAAARRDGRRAPGEADRLHQAELREKRRASQTSARGKLASTRVGEKRARRGDARGNHCRERGAAGSQRAVPIRRDVHHDPHRGRLCLRPLCTSRRRHATSAPPRKIRASSGCRNGRRLVPLACRLFFFSRAKIFFFLFDAGSANVSE